MMYFCFILRFFVGQGINLSVQDLYDSSWSVSGWSATTAGGLTSSYNTISTQCNNQNMLKLTDSYLTYSKTYTIQDQEFYKIFIDLEVYFYQFTQTSINILVNSNIIYSQSFTNQILTLNNICNTGSDSQFIIQQEFYTSLTTLIIQIKYIQNIPNTSSFIGIKNLNIYTNGIPLIGGCSMNTPLSSLGTCVNQCTTTNPYLTGEYFTQCASGPNTSYAQTRYYYTSVANFAMSSPPLNGMVSAYFDGTNKLINSNYYTSSIFHSNLFTNQFQTSSPIYQANFGSQGFDKLQFCFIFYAFGTWDEGSFVKIYIAGTSIYKNNMISISKTQGKLISSTQSIFYDTNVTQSSVQQVAKKTLISFSAHYYGSNQVQFCFTQVLQGSTASYGFGDIVFYKAPQDPNFNFPSNTDIYGLPYTCINGLYAYNGTCVTTCPVFSFSSNTNYNCTDYSISESSIYNPALSISSNAYGTYIVKLFYQNNFDQSDIDSLFQTKPPSTKNYLNSESFSFIKSKKILGGYNSWGYGTYQATFSNLIAHYQVRLFFTLYLIDGWQIGDTFTYLVDGAVAGTYTSSPSIQYQGLSTLDTIYIISGRKVAHGSSTLSISFNCNIAQKDASKASCGIQNLFVLLDQNVNVLCPLSNQFFSYTTQNCETCTSTSCQLFPSNTISAKCSIGCLTCSSSTVCTVCDTSNGYQLSGNACICLSNYIMISSICQKCHYQCTTCSGTAQNQCSTCDSTRTKTGNTCLCNATYYDVFSITACAAVTTTCHYSCNTCFGLQYYQCLTCPSSSFRTYQSSSNTCPCDVNYSDNGLANCYTCHTSCLTCSAAGSTSCSSCDSSKNRSTLSSGSCPCDTGYNDKLNVGNACVANYTPCHYSCSTCYGALETNCLICLPANYRTVSSNSCPCNNGYTDINSATCIQNYTPCNYSCLTCFGATQNQCLTCPTTRNLSIISIGTNSSCVCQDGTYNNNVATCPTCDSTCKTCTAAGSSSCSSCSSAQNRTLSGTACPCSTGYNEISNPGTCVLNYTPCHFSCLTCYGGSNTNCITCSSANFRTISTNQCPCNSGYAEANVAICVSSCSYSCLTCFGNSATQCSSCPTTRNMNTVMAGTNQSCDCQDGTYNNNVAFCVVCNSTCKTCTAAGSSSCSSCESTQNRTQSGTTCPCSTGYNEISNPGTCVLNYTPCHYSCQTCFGSSNTNCLTCPSGNHRTFSSNSCPCDGGYIDLSIVLCKSYYTPCIHSCLTCFGASGTNCITCPATRNLLINSTGINQICQCQDGTFDNSVATCAACDSTCKTCTAAGSSSCSSCDPSNNRTQSGNTCPCSSGYNDSLNPGNTCAINYTPCHFSCQTCYQSQSNNCLSCNSSNNRTFQSASKTCQCNANYSEIGTAACLLSYTPCHQSCLTCYGPAQDQCSSCGIGRAINVVSVGVQSTCPCATSYYVSGSQCLSCHITCLNCDGSSSSDCTGCDASAFRQLDNNQCPCFVAFNDILNPGTCVNDYIPCHVSCNTCFGPSNNQCITCNTNRTLISYTCPCSTGYNEIMNSGTCVLNHSPCNQQCQSCYGGLNNNCITCDPNNLRTFDPNTKTCPCNVNFIDIGQVLCVQLYNPCYSSCNTCFGGQINQCISCPSTRTLNQVSIGNQRCDCNPRYYDILGASQCSPCDITCATCNDGSNLNCLTCNANRIFSSGTCPCIANYNDLKGTLNDCQLNYSPCHLSCFTCFGGNINQCLDCPLGSLRIYNNSSNTCDCPSGYDDSQQLCTYICHNTCLTCNGPSQTDCLTCNTAIRWLSGTTCLCNSGTNDVLNPPTCTVDLTFPSCYANYVLTCFGISNNQALTCNLTLNRTLHNNICSCIDGYFEDSLNGNICAQCHYSCLTCSTTSQYCLSCSSQKFRQISNNSCPCIQNYKEVNQNCITCTNWDCLTCDNQQNCLSCVSQIKYVSNGLCICVDGYYQQGSSCLECENTCLSCNGPGIKQCLSCDDSVYRIINFGLCVCMNGYQENINKQCTDCQSNEGILIFQCQYKNSQDGVWTYGEQCDDGNNDPRDGCDNQMIQPNYSCINIINEPSICYKCPDNCIKCTHVDDQITCNSCQDQYYNTQLSCIQCADSKCLYCITPSQCSVCIDNTIPQNGKCFDCENGFYKIGEICQSECGDGIKTYDEECDDGNYYSGDGCSDKCLIEENFICQITSQLSTCQINTPPKLIINQISATTNIKKFQIQTDQSVFQQNVFLDVISNETQFILEYHVTSDQSFSTLLIDANLTFLQSFDSFEIQFYVGGQIYNIYNQNLSSRSFIININNIQVMNQQESYISSQASKMGEGTLITFASVSIFQLLLGGAQQFIQFLNMIQKLQYIKYINIDFPPNLNQFLEIFDRFSLQPIFQFVQLNNILALFGDESVPYVEPSKKFLENGINAYFLSNIQDYFLTLLSGIFINYIFQIIVIILENIKSKFGERQFFLMKQLYTIVYKSQRLFIKSIQFFQKYGFMQLTLMSCFDIQFAILIQLSNQNYDDTNLAINCGLAYGFILFYITIVIKFLSFKDEEQNNYIIWQSTFCTIRMIESCIFMLSIVNLQNFPQCQVIIISLSSFSISIYTWAFRPLKSNLNNYKLVIQELALFVTNISFVGYIYFPSQINQINLGWFQIASYGSMILGNLIIELYSNAKIIKTMFSQKQTRKYESPRLLM